MTVARYPVHQMIQDLMRDPAKAAAFKEDPEPVFEHYGLTEEERLLLLEGSSAALNELGVHPNLQMKYAWLRPAAPGPRVRSAAPGGPLAAYLHRLLER